MFHFVYDYFKSQPVGEATSADSDALKHTVAGQLVHHKRRIKQSGRLVVVWHNASDEMGISLVQGGQKGIQLGSEGRRHCLESFWTGIFALLLLLPLVGIFLWLARMISEDDGDENSFRLMSSLANLKR